MRLTLSLIIFSQHKDREFCSFDDDEPSYSSKKDEEAVSSAKKSLATSPFVGLVALSLPGLDASFQGLQPTHHRRTYAYRSLNSSAAAQ